MSDNFQSDRPRQDQVQNDNVIIERREPPDTTMPMVVYALYLVSFVVGFTSVIGVVIAYVYRGKGPGWLDEHYRYQIRTFWIGLLWTVIGFVTTMLIIGWFILVGIAIWVIYRVVVGALALNDGKAPGTDQTR